MQMTAGERQLAKCQELELLGNPGGEPEGFPTAFVVLAWTPSPAAVYLLLIAIVQ